MKRIDLNAIGGIIDMEPLGMNGASVVMGTMFHIDSQFSRFITEPLSEATEKVLSKRKHQYIFTR